MIRRSVLPLHVAALAAALGAALPAAADEVLRWNEVATGAAAAAGTDPLTESRAFAMMHAAVHDAVSAVAPQAAPASASARAPGTSPSPEAAVAAAAHGVLVALLPAAKPALDAALEESLRAVPDGAAEDRAVRAGRRAAAATLGARSTDGADRPFEVAPGTRPGEYRPTPPDLTPALFGHWGRVRPFVLRTSDQFRPSPPPKPESARARAEVEEVRLLGAKDGSARTDEQSEIARYWYENSTQGWNRITREVAAARSLSIRENARLFALVNFALADGFIAGFEAKYHYAYWRPATAIRAAGHADWLSYLDTPPVPDHPSTHTVLGAAAATVLARFFGTDLVAFEMTSGEPYSGITRRFWSFSEAARENGASRILAGLHFASAVDTGYAQGEAVGSWVFEHGLARDGEAVAVSASSR